MCFASAVSTTSETWFFSKLKIAFDKFSKTSFSDTLENSLKIILLLSAYSIISELFKDEIFVLTWFALSKFLKLNWIKSLFYRYKKKTRL